MIREQDLIEAIAECQGERNPNANTCIKLAAYYTILDNLRGETPQPMASYDANPAENPPIDLHSGSEFAQAVNGMNADDILPLIDELVQTVAAIAPPVYEAFMRELRIM